MSDLKAIKKMLGTADTVIFYSDRNGVTICLYKDGIKFSQLITNENIKSDLSLGSIASYLIEQLEETVERGFDNA